MNGKLTKPRMCDRCHVREAVWAKQYIASDKPTYVLLGWHYRGFPLERLCIECMEADERKEQEQGEAVG